jgi:hypothetical protein
MRIFNMITKNKNLFIIILFCVVLISLKVYSQGVIKRINTGYLDWPIADSFDEGEGDIGWGLGGLAFWDNYYYPLFQSKAVFIACSNWTDTLGNVQPIGVTGHGQWETDDLHVTIPVPDAIGYTINRYLRYQPPAVTVDNTRVDAPFPLNYADHVDPGVLPGNSDVMVQSLVNTNIGVTVKYRVIGFYQQNHNKYIIREYTLINTGNVNSDPKIELPNQTLTGLYFLKQLRPREDPFKDDWCSAYGEYPNQNLRIVYAYPSRGSGSTYDIFGDPLLDKGGFMDFTYFEGEEILFASKSPQEFSVDDPNQPQMTGYYDCDFPGFTYHPLDMTDSYKQLLYNSMQTSNANIPPYNWPMESGARTPNHGVRLDERGFEFPSQMEGYGYTSTPAYSIGPYTLQPGDSVKIVTADLFGSISPEKSYEVGNAWLNNNASWGDNIIGGSTDILPPQYKVHPELYAQDSQSSELNNWAKDNWVMSGRDSLFQDAMEAKWAYDNNFMVPAPPPPPSLTVTSFPDKIQVEWGKESEAGTNFAGYTVYRAQGSYYPNVPDGQTNLIGSWSPIFSCGPGTGNALTNSYQDVSAQRGVAYYYSVEAFDNGSQTNYTGQKQVFHSSLTANMTTKAAYLLKPGGQLKDIVVVPNPYNISASQIQYTGEPNKILFLNVPSTCTIRIFTEAGDLVKTIYHQGSGDASWGDLPAEHMTTESGQIVASGLYIALIQTPDGQSAIRKFVIVR